MKCPECGVRLPKMVTEVREYLKSPGTMHHRITRPDAPPHKIGGLECVKTQNKQLRTKLIILEPIAKALCKVGTGRYGLADCGKRLSMIMKAIITRATAYDMLIEK